MDDHSFWVVSAVTFFFEVKCPQVVSRLLGAFKLAILVRNKLASARTEDVVSGVLSVIGPSVVVNPGVPPLHAERQDVHVIVAIVRIIKL